MNNACLIARSAQINSGLPFDECADQLAREFMAARLPPVLLPSQAKRVLPAAASALVLPRSETKAAAKPFNESAVSVPVVALRYLFVCWLVRLLN